MQTVQTATNGVQAPLKTTKTTDLQSKGNKALQEKGMGENNHMISFSQHSIVSTVQNHLEM